MRCPGTDNSSIKIVFGEQGYATRMVNMRVRKNNAGDALWVKRQRSVLLRGIFATTLKHATIEKDTIGICRQKMHRAGNFPNGTIKRYFHFNVTPQSDFIVWNFV